MDVKKKKNIISPPLGLCTSQNLNFSAFQAAMQLGSSAVSALPMLIRAAVENEPPSAFYGQDSNSARHDNMRWGRCLEGFTERLTC